MIFQTSGAMSIRNFNGLSLLVLFVGGYFATVLMAWAVLLIDYASNPFRPESALSVLTPAGIFLVFGLQPLITPLFLSPVLLILVFSLLSVRVKFNKRRWLIILVTLLLAANLIAGLLLSFNNRSSTAFFFLASGTYLSIWLSVGFVLVKISHLTWLKAPTDSAAA
jgi:hypothetical protein